MRVRNKVVLVSAIVLIAVLSSFLILPIVEASNVDYSSNFKILDRPTPYSVVVEFSNIGDYSVGGYCLNISNANECVLYISFALNLGPGHSNHNMYVKSIRLGLANALGSSLEVDVPNGAYTNPTT